MYANRAYNYYERKCSVWHQSKMYRVQKCHHHHYMHDLVLVCMKYGMCMERQQYYNFPDESKSHKHSLSQWSLLFSIHNLFRFGILEKILLGSCIIHMTINLFVIPLVVHYFATVSCWCVGGCENIVGRTHMDRWWGKKKRERKTNPSTSFLMKVSGYQHIASLSKATNKGICECVWCVSVVFVWHEIRSWIMAHAIYWIAPSEIALQIKAINWTCLLFCEKIVVGKWRKSTFVRSFIVHQHYHTSHCIRV